VSTRSTQVSTLINAPREVVYGALLDPDAVAAWLPPDGMTGKIHAYEPRAGGAFHMSLMYINPQDSLPGKTFEGTDTVEGKFLELVPNEKIVQITEFESDDPDFAGEMRITWTLADADAGTLVTVLMENIPTGIRLEDNELGSRLSLRNLAAFVERGIS
jgi:uncharacterized protein YndB with AHSA1/START domain